jgi:hypothetical protein
VPIAIAAHRPFVNGDFEDGLRGWSAGQGPFAGHGSGLPQSVEASAGNRRALLGQPDNWPNGTIPVGYGVLSQTFTLDKRYVRLQYWVFSYDKAKGQERYWDTFEVSVNRPPPQITVQERNDRGCATTVLNPEGTLSVPTEGLVFCGGSPGPAGGPLWDTGRWKSVTLDLSAFRGELVTLYLAVWSREYSSSSYDDRAWFNTWAYVDNIQLVDAIYPAIDLCVPGVRVVEGTCTQ